MVLLIYSLKMGRVYQKEVLKAIERAQVVKCLLGKADPQYPWTRLPDGLSLGCTAL